MNHLEHRLEHEKANFGLKSALDMLAEEEARLQGALAEVRRMQTAVRSEACQLELATWTFDEPKELAPTKDQFIKLFGQAEFDRCKRMSKPKRLFVWLV